MIISIMATEWFSLKMGSGSANLVTGYNKSQLNGPLLYLIENVKK